MSSIGYATLQVIPSLKGLSGSVTAQLNSQMATAGTQAGAKMGDATGRSFISSFAKHVGSIAVGVLVAQGVKQIADFMGDAFIGFNSQMQTANVGFTTMLGSAKKAGDFLDQLTDFAAKTPFDTADIINYSRQLLAMGVSAKDIIPYMTGIGDAAAGLGTGTEGVQALTRAIGQMTAKGKVQSDELLQLTEAGVPALRILAEHYGVTTGEMQKMVTAGKVMASEAVPALINGLEKGTAATAAFGGMMAAQSQTFSGAWANIKDTATKAIGEATLPLFNKLSDAMVGLSNIVQGPGFAAFTNMLGQKASDGLDIAAEATGKFVGWLKSLDWAPLGAALGTVKDAIIQLGPPLLELFKSQAGSGGIFQTLIDAAPLVANAVKLTSDILVAFVDFLANHATTVQVFATAILAVNLALKGLAIASAITAGIEGLIAFAGSAAAFISLAKGIRSVAEAMALLDIALDANPVGIIIVAVVALIAILVALEVKFHWMETAWDGIKVAWQATADWFSGPFVDFFKGVGDWFSGPFLVPFQAIGAFFSGPFLVPFQAIGTFFTETLPAWLETAVGFFTSLPGRIWDAIVSIPGLMLQMLEQAAYLFGYGVGLVVKEMLALPGQITAIAESIWSFLSGWANRVWQGLVSLWHSTVTAVVNEWNALPGQIIALANSIWDWLTGWGTRIWQGVQTAWRNTVNFAVYEFHNLPSQVASIADTVWSNIKSFCSNLISTVTNGFRDLVEGAIREFRALPGQAYSIALTIGSKIQSAVAGAGHWLYDAGKDAVLGLIHGVESMFGAVGSIFRDLAGKAMAGFKDALGIHSPSRVFQQFGQFTVAGFVNGVTGAAPKAVDAVANMLGAANAPVTAGPTAAVGGGSRTLNYYAAPGNSLSAEEDLFAAGRRAALVF